MTDAATEYLIACLTAAAAGSVITLLTCGLCGCFHGFLYYVARLQDARVEAYTAGHRNAVKLMQRAEQEAEFTEHSAQVG